MRKLDVKEIHGYNNARFEADQAFDESHRLSQ